MAKHTVRALEAYGTDFVVTAAGSCAVTVGHEYAHLLRDEPGWRERAERLAGRTLDVVTFLDRVAGVAALPALPAAGAPAVT